MPQLLEKLNRKHLIWLLSGVLAVGVVILIVLLCLQPGAPQPQAAVETTEPVPSLL